MRLPNHTGCPLCGGSGKIIIRKRGYVRRKVKRVGRRPGEYTYEAVTVVEERVCPRGLLAMGGSYPARIMYRHVKSYIYRPRPVPKPRRNKNKKNGCYRARGGKR